jgi:hypothetical protein
MRCIQINVGFWLRRIGIQLATASQGTRGRGLLDLVVVTQQVKLLMALTLELPSLEDS